MPRSASIVGGAVSPHSSTILVVDDDSSLRQSTGALLRTSGYLVFEAANGAEGVAVLRREPIALALIDWQLPDMNGFDVVRTILAERRMPAWILVSGFMDYERAREAGSLGALRAVSPPFDVESVVTRALVETEKKADALTWPPHPLRELRPARSAVEQCARLILLAVNAEEDPKTLYEWARAAHVGYSTLKEVCRIARVEAHAARDFTRIVRMLILAEGRIPDPSTYLRIGDHRTEELLMIRAGLAGRPIGDLINVDDALNHQQFIAPSHPVLQGLRALMRHL